ncbi:hypothetical protein KSP39_PZI019812 [Platanthera zijinensis]|uniref:Uncharacterized protein n=1 Tax=Platanthera zijinensis TaxID=2320716 RepID=A0AAP0FXV8_9ASPA
MSFHHTHLLIGDFGSRDVSNFEGVDSKSCKSCPSLGPVIVGDDHLNCRNIEIVEANLLRTDLDNSSDEDDLNDVVLQKLENMHVKQTICSSTKKISQISFPNTTELLDLSKCATKICSEVLQSCPSIFAETESSTIELDNESSISVKKSEEDSPLPFHVPSKLVSALKGTRALWGKPLDRNTRVKWAENVYEPPVTISSHTVKGHRHHRPPKSKKDHHKHKHSKCKPSASGSERKSSQRRSNVSDPRMHRSQALPTVIPLQAGFGRSKMQQVLEESNCGGSFHSESPWPSSLPVAEAS